MPAVTDDLNELSACQVAQLHARFQPFRSCWYWHVRDVAALEESMTWGWVVLSISSFCEQTASLEHRYFYAIFVLRDCLPLTKVFVLCCRFKLPVSTPSACAFAGADLSTLYITTIDDKSKCKGAGGLWSYKLPGLSGWSASHIAKPLD